MSTRVEPTPLSFLIAGTLLGFGSCLAFIPNNSNGQTIPPAETRFDTDSDGKLSDAEFITGLKLLAEQQRALIDLHNQSKKSD